MAVRRSEALSVRALYEAYPFLPGAQELAGELDVSVKGLLADPALERARTIGRARILAAADDPRAATAVEELAHAGGDERFLSFQFARLVLSAGAPPAALRRWAVAEAKRSHARLSSADVPELGEVARRLGFGFEPRGKEIGMTVVDYVRLCVPIREAEFRLARQRVAGGEVRVDPPRAARLLQEAVRLRLAEPLPVADEVRAEVARREASLLDELSRRTPLPVARGGGGAVGLLPERFPPCIRKMRRMLEHGENLSHAGRFCLAAFLHRAGADFETIVDAYRGAPDFDESITRYQVEHITHRDDGRGYEPPECATLRSHGLCLREGDPTATAAVDRGRDELCFEPRLRHPLQYYRIRGGRVLEPEREPSGSATPSGPASGR